MKDLSKIIMIAGVKSITALLGFVTAMLAARIFHPADFGRLSLVWSMATVFAVFLDLGSSIAFRKLGHNAGAAPERIGRALVSFCVRALVVLIVVLPVIRLFAPSGRLDIFVYIVPLSLGFAIEILLAEVFRVRQSYFWAEIFSGAFRQAIYLAVLLVALVFALRLSAVVAALGLSVMLMALVILNRAGRPAVARERSYLLGWDTLAEGGQQFRFFCTQALIMLGQQFPLLAAGLVASNRTAAVVRISMLFGVVMQFAIAANSLYFAPKLARLEAGDSAGLLYFVRYSSLTGLIFVPAGFVLAVLLPFFVNLMFGGVYTASVLGAQLIVGIYAMSSCYGAYAQMLLMRGGDRVNLGAAAAMLIGESSVLAASHAVFPVNSFALSYCAGILCSLTYLAVFGYRFSGIWPGAIFARTISAPKS